MHADAAAAAVATTAGTSRTPLIAAAAGAVAATATATPPLQRHCVDGDFKPVERFNASNSAAASTSIEPAAS